MSMVPTQELDPTNVSAMQGEFTTATGEALRWTVPAVIAGVALRPQIAAARGQENLVIDLFPGTCPPQGIGTRFSVGIKNNSNQFAAVTMNYKANGVVITEAYTSPYVVRIRAGETYADAGGYSYPNAARPDMPNPNGGTMYVTEVKDANTGEAIPTAFDSQETVCNNVAPQTTTTSSTTTTAPPAQPTTTTASTAPHQNAPSSPNTSTAPRPRVEQKPVVETPEEATTTSTTTTTLFRQPNPEPNQFEGSSQPRPVDQARRTALVSVSKENPSDRTIIDGLGSTPAMVGEGILALVGTTILARRHKQRRASTTPKPLERTPKPWHPFRRKAA